MDALSDTGTLACVDRVKSLKTELEGLQQGF